MRCVVLLHGFAGSGASWDDVRCSLPSGDLVLSPDLYGHGGAAPLGEISSFECEVERLVKMVEAALDQRRLESSRRAGEPGRSSPDMGQASDETVIAGYSLGGRLALGVALRLAHRGAFASGRLVLIGTNPGLRNAQERRARREQDEAWASSIERLGVAAFLDCWRQQPLFSSQGSLEQEVLERQRLLGLGHDASALAAAMRVLGLADMPSHWDRLGQFTRPVDWVVGALDRKFRHLAMEAVTRCPRGRVITIENVGHNVLLEAPERLVAILTGEESAVRPHLVPAAHEHSR